MKALITRKVGMTSTIGDDGVVTAITLLSASPCVITQVKTTEVDGYTAVQVGFEEAKEGKTSKAQVGHFKAAGKMPKIVREFRVVLALVEAADQFLVGELRLRAHALHQDQIIVLLPGGEVVEDRQVATAIECDAAILAFGSFQGCI